MSCTLLAGLPHNHVFDLIKVTYSESKNEAPLKKNGKYLINVGADYH